MRERTTKRTWLFAGCAVCILLPGIYLAVTMGALSVEFSDIWNGLFHNSGSTADLMIRDVRLPRVICVLMTGGILGFTGAMMQGVMRNPVAEPSLLGISQGATLIVAFFYAAGIGAGTAEVMMAALLGALLSGAAVVVFTMRNPANMSMTRLLLAGTAMSLFFTALTTVTGLLSNRAQMIAFWVSGGFRGVSWAEVKLIVPAGAAGLAIAAVLAFRINILSLGDDVAVGLGENPQAVRMAVIGVMIPLCAAAVAVGKTIGFVGLMVPQTVRLIVGEDYRKIIPCSFLAGSVLLTYADVAARMLFAPYEIPVGIFTALLGVPFFLYMAGKERG